MLQNKRTSSLKRYSKHGLGAILHNLSYSPNPLVDNKIGPLTRKDVQENVLKAVQYRKLAPRRVIKAVNTNKRAGIWRKTNLRYNPQFIPVSSNISTKLVKYKSKILRNRVQLVTRLSLRRFYLKRGELIKKIHNIGSWKKLKLKISKKTRWLKWRFKKTKRFFNKRANMSYKYKMSRRAKKSRVDRRQRNQVIGRRVRLPRNYITKRKINLGFNFKTVYIKFIADISKQHSLNPLITTSSITSFTWFVNVFTYIIKYTQILVFFSKTSFNNSSLVNFVSNLNNTNLLLPNIWTSKSNKFNFFSTNFFNKSLANSYYRTSPIYQAFTVAEGTLSLKSPHHTNYNRKTARKIWGGAWVKLWRKLWRKKLKRLKRSFRLHARRRPKKLKRLWKKRIDAFGRKIRKPYKRRPKHWWRNSKKSAIFLASLLYCASPYTNLQLLTTYKTVASNPNPLLTKNLVTGFHRRASNALFNNDYFSHLTIRVPTFVTYIISPNDVYNDEVLNISWASPSLSAHTLTYNTSFKEHTTYSTLYDFLLSDRYLYTTVLPELLSNHSYGTKVWGNKTNFNHKDQVTYYLVNELNALKSGLLSRFTSNTLAQYKRKFNSSLYQAELYNSSRQIRRVDTILSKLSLVYHNNPSNGNFYTPGVSTTLALTTNSVVQPYSTTTPRLFTLFLSRFNNTGLKWLLRDIYFNPTGFNKFDSFLAVCGSNLLNNTFNERLSSLKYSNITPISWFNFKLQKRVFKVFSYNKFAINITFWYYTTLIKFIENCSGHKVFLKFNPFLLNALSFGDHARSFLWKNRISGFQRMLGHRIFLVESLKIIHLALRSKDPVFFANWIKGMLGKMSFWRFKVFFRYLRYVMRYLFWAHFTELEFRGLKLCLKGKVSVAGNARTRSIKYRIGETSNSTFDNRVVHDYSIINTFTGVLGFQIWLYF